MSRENAEIRSLMLTKISYQAIVDTSHDRCLTFHTRQDGREVRYNVLFDEMVANIVIDLFPRRSIRASGTSTADGRFVVRQLEVLGQWYAVLP